MRLLTKAEACRELGVSLSTLDRRIASGELQVRQEEHKRRHRVYVMLDDSPMENSEDGQSQDTARERIRRLEEQVELLKSQLDLERERRAGLEEVCSQERAARERMRRTAFILGLAVAGLLGMLVAGVLVAWSPLA